MLFDLCYLGALCTIIIFTFVQVLLPLPALKTSLALCNTDILSHLSLTSLSYELTLLFCGLGLLFLKMIWRLINPPQHF